MTRRELVSTNGKERTLLYDAQGVSALFGRRTLIRTYM